MCLSVFSHNRHLKNRCRNGRQTWHKNVLQQVLEINLFWGQRLEVKVTKVTKTVPAWIFALLLVLPSWRLLLVTSATKAMFSTLFVTACAVVQAVVKATSQSNWKGQILTTWGSETPEQIPMKLGIYNRVAGMPTHANSCGAATTWVVWANTWKNTCCGFLGVPF